MWGREREGVRRGGVGRVICGAGGWPRRRQPAAPVGSRARAREVAADLRVHLVERSRAAARGHAIAQLRGRAAVADGLVELLGELLVAVQELHEELRAVAVEAVDVRAHAAVAHRQAAHTRLIWRAAGQDLARQRGHVCSRAGAGAAGTIEREARRRAQARLRARPSSKPPSRARSRRAAAARTAARGVSQMPAYDSPVMYTSCRANCGCSRRTLLRSTCADCAWRLSSHAPQLCASPAGSSPQ